MHENIKIDRQSNQIGPLPSKCMRAAILMFEVIFLYSKEVCDEICAPFP